MDPVGEFLSRVEAVHRTGAATEHSYRSAIEKLFSSLDPAVMALNEPKRVACGAPDFIVQRGDIVVGHVEAKDIGVGLRDMADKNRAQQDRYRNALPNLIYTNCLDWDFYRDGEPISSIKIGAYSVSGIRSDPRQFEGLQNLLRDFVSQHPQTVTSPKLLAEIMAGKAVLIKDVLRNALAADKELRTELTNQYHAFREHLIHDITTDDFADIYAETIAYGMFAARLHDKTPNTFSRREALELLPKSNPFLRSLFGYIAGPDLDDRIQWIIDDLAQVFRAVDINKIMEGFGKLTGKDDPFLHFYETFLAAYNPAKRKARGVWYTPEAVVNFIVRSVDQALQAEFGLPHGIADTSKVVVDWDTGQTDRKGKPITLRKEVHRVQILDPATGTGTFLAEIIKQIAPKVKAVAEGVWSSYVERDLIPRLHGFELLMASYAMCHMKLDMILTALGYKPTSTPPRLSVYLTNSLEEGEPANQSLPFAQWLSNEVKQANTIKRDMPIMCAIGNPPYSGESANKSEWIMKLMEAYKKEPGTNQRLNERNPKWINDDYVKFIRLSEHLIEKNGDGVLGFITNHGYLDNPTFRGMRWHLLNTFDKIYILDLHGNSKKKEVSPDGQPDKNVFDIQQGVAVIIAIKKRSASATKPLARVYHADLWGERASKYEALIASSLHGEMWQELEIRAPQYPFARREYALEAAYNQGFGLDEFMPVHGNGVVTKRDNLNIRSSEGEVRAVINDFLSLTEGDVRRKYGLPPDVRDWRYAWALDDIRAHHATAPVAKIQYRPFDSKFIFYSGVARGLVGWPVKQIMRHYLAGENIGLLAPKAIRDSTFAHAFVTRDITEAIFLSGTTGSNAMNFPLYLFPDEQDLDRSRHVNFEPVLYKRIQKVAKDPERGVPNEIAVFDYIYGVLYCPEFRRIYDDLLKRGYPRIPWPTSPREFWSISDKGGALRTLHLLDVGPPAGQTPFAFIGAGSAMVDKLRYEARRVWINDDQFFENVEKEIWEFYIGGYQPAQKWLKDRKGSNLSFEEITHYQRILWVLSETYAIMKTINMTLDAA